MAMREELNHDGSEYRFVDDEILGPFGELHCVAALPPVPTFLQPGEADEALIAMQRQRYQQMVRSTMVLSITDLIAGIGAKQPSRLSLSAAAAKAARHSSNSNHSAVAAIRPDITPLKARSFQVTRSALRNRSPNTAHSSTHGKFSSAKPAMIDSVWTKWRLRAG